MIDVATLFAAHKLRCTRQRQAVYEALMSCTSHPTAEELHRMVTSRDGHMSLATVYNTLDALCDAGLCRKLATTSGSGRYDADLSDHMHVRFRESGEIMDVPEDISERLSRHLAADALHELASRLNIEIDGISVQILARKRS
jgi:Fur family peroxide stress response transcriptional regulator